MFRRRPDPFAALSLDSQYQEPEEHGSFLNAVVRSEGGFLEAADNAEREANRSARAYRRQPAGEYISPFRGEEHHEVAQINKMKRYPTVSANSAFAHVHPRELGFRTFGHETKRAKDIPFPMYLRENEARQDELLRQVQVREARLAHVKNSQILYDYTAEGKRKRAKAAAKAKAREKEKEEDKKKNKSKGKGKAKSTSKAEETADAKSNSSEKPGNQAQELTPEATPEPRTPAEDAGDDLETIEGDLGSAYTFETVPEGASYDYVIEYEAVAPGATHGPKTAKPVRPVRRADKAAKEAKSPSKVKAKAKESVAKGGEPVVTKKESKRIEPQSAAGKNGSKTKGSKKPVSSKEWKEVKSHIEPVVVEGGPHGAGKHVEPVLVTKETRNVEKSFESNDENQEEITSVQPKDAESSGVTSVQPEHEVTSVQPKDTETGEVTGIQPKDEEQGVQPLDEEASALEASQDADAEKVQQLLGKSTASSKKPAKNSGEKVLEAAPDVGALGTGLAAADAAINAEESPQEENMDREISTETADEIALDAGSDQAEDESELAAGVTEEEGEEGAPEEVGQEEEEEHNNDEEEEELELDEHDMQSEVSSITSEPVDHRTVPRVLTFPEFEPKQSKFSFKKNTVTQRPTNPLASPNDPELMVKTDREGFLSKAVYDKVKYDNRRHEKWLVEFTQTEKEKCEQKQVEYDERLAYLRKKVDKLQARMQKIREAADRKLEITHNEMTTKLFQETHEFIQMKNKIFLETKAIQEQKERETAEVKVKQGDVQKEIDALNSERDDVQREYISWSNRLAEMSAHLDAKISKLVTIRHQYRSTQGEIDLLTERKAAMEKEMEENKKTHAENTKAIESYTNKEYLPRVHEIDDKISGLLSELSIIKQESANEKVKLGNITKELEKERIAHEEKLRLEAEERQRKEEDLLGKQREEAEARAAKIKKKHEKELRKMKKSYEKQLKELKEQQSKRDDDGAAGGAASGDASGGDASGGDASGTAKDEGVTTTVTKTVSKSSTKVVNNNNADDHKSTTTGLDSSTNGKSPLANVGTSGANEKVNHKYHSGRPSMDSSLFEYVTEEEILPA
ncbi:YGR130C [Zygosaccharomyces parabailii]|nr:YGR130C [Zygosaccharomyces parabailii]